MANITTFYPGASAPPASAASPSASNASAYGFIAGQVLQIGSSIYGGILQNSISKANAQLFEAQGNYSSSVAEFNAAVSRANQTAIRAAADLEIEAQKKAEKRFHGAQVAGYAKAGVKLTGSPAEVLIDTATEFKKQQAITDYNAKIGMMQAGSQAQAYDIMGTLAKSEASTKAQLSRIEGKSRITDSISRSGTNLLTSSVDFYRSK